MRKLILISAFVFASASVSAQAGDSRSLILAANDAPAAAATKTEEVKPEAVKPEAAAEASKETVKETVKPEAKKQASKPEPRTHARRSYEGDEAKARRIAARYGIYW